MGVLEGCPACNDAFSHWGSAVARELRTASGFGAWAWLVLSVLCFTMIPATTGMNTSVVIRPIRDEVAMFPQWGQRYDSSSLT